MFWEQVTQSRGVTLQLEIEAPNPGFSRKTGIGERVTAEQLSKSAVGLHILQKPAAQKGCRGYLLSQPLSEATRASPLPTTATSLVGEGSALPSAGARKAPLPKIQTREPGGLPYPNRGQLGPVKAK